MAYTITKREPYRLSIKLCGATKVPPLLARARPIASSKASFNIGNRATNSFPVIRPTTDRQRIPLWAEPYVTSSEASLQNINGSDYFILGPGAPLCQQAISGGTVSLVAYSSLGVSQVESNGDTTINVSVNFGPLFDNRNKGLSSFRGSVYGPPPLDAISGNTPSLYEVVVFSGSFSSMTIYWKGNIVVSINDGLTTSSPKVCGITFLASSSTQSSNQPQVGMNASGGAT